MATSNKKCLIIILVHANPLLYMKGMVTAFVEAEPGMVTAFVKDEPR
jgi:hypothetical protein